MKRIIGIPKLKSAAAVKGNNLNDAIASVDDRANNIQRKIDECNKEIKAISLQLNKVSEGAAKNTLKIKAQRLIQRRKGYENQCEALRDQSFKMEETSFGLQSGLANNQLILGMRAGMYALKKAQKKIHVDDIENLQDKLGEMLEISEDLQHSLSRNFSLPESIDDEELKAELDALGDDLINDKDFSCLEIAINTDKSNDDGNGPPPPPLLPQRSPTSPSPSPAPVSANKPNPNPQQIINGAPVDVDEFGLPQITFP